MVAKNLLDEVLALPVAERIEFLQQLRENLRNDPELFPLTDDQKRLLDDRLADFEREPEEGSSLEDVEARILANLRDQPCHD